LDVDGIGGSEGYGRLGFDLGNVGVGMEYGVVLRLEDLVLANYVGGADGWRQRSMSRYFDIIFG
jgi:hypothetical protein